MNPNKTSPERDSKRCADGKGQEEASKRCRLSRDHQPNFSQPLKLGDLLQKSSSLMPLEQATHLEVNFLQQLDHLQPDADGSFLQSLKFLSQPGTLGLFLQNASTLTPLWQARHLAVNALQHPSLLQPGGTDGRLFLQYSSSLIPSLQELHLALFALQQLYFSQPPVDGFFLQYSFSLKPATQASHLAALTLLPLEQARQSAVFALQQPFFSQPGTSRFLFFLQNLSTLLPSEQARQSAVNALQQPLPPSPLWYFSQPCTPPKKSDGFFLQNSSSLMPCLQDSHLALYAWQQFLYF
eukprot:CAMPEP_0198474556 /NCGR_PEP_ID=MMETSP1456-20131121/40371_1 /TAXON_ID=1461544 ORGANISM="Unidentified sp., Strain RCC1871" /NCGR_SAMPLE_ID=MMETSP1456 /ASSEMBLY_ACC=CAM_ASM_001119 /LENGTH=295 /DNA_ID=CAMNT_0044201253 /DNA_START=54 /DNA_END=937 /DNA_ORIENTATION=+